jgi:uncharacterized membrane protein YhhN
VKVPGRITRPHYFYQEFCMGSSSSDDGIWALVVSFIVASALISILTGDFGHWPFVIFGIVIGLMAVSAINR